MPKRSNTKARAKGRPGRSGERPVAIAKHPIASRANLRPTPRTITASAAARQFAAIVDEVRRTGEAVIVTQHGRPACRIAPPPAPESTIDGLIDTLTRGPRPDADFADTLEGITRSQPPAPSSPWDE